MFFSVSQESTAFSRLSANPQLSTPFEHNFLYSAPHYLNTSGALTYKKTCKKAKRGLELVSQPPFLHDFGRKSFSTLYSINWLNFVVWLPYYLFGILSNMYTLIVCFPDCDFMNFKIYLSFLIKPNFYMTKNMTKI